MLRLSCGKKPYGSDTMLGIDLLYSSGPKATIYSYNVQGEYAGNPLTGGGNTNIQIYTLTVKLLNSAELTTVYSIHC